MMKIAIIGASGQLGTDIQTVLHSPHYSLIIINRQQANLETPGLLTAYVNTLCNIDYVINCAALTDTQECERNREKAFQINALTVLELINFCQRCNSTLIHFSTDYVFDGQKKYPYLETDPTSPVNIYGHSKVAAEEMITRNLDRYFILRVSSLFGQAGKSGTGKNFVETILGLATRGKAFTVVADQIMSPTHTLEVARTVKVILDNQFSEYGIYHCSSTGECSWYEFACEILTHHEMKSLILPIPAEQYETIVVRPAYSVLDTTKITAIYPPKNWRVALTEYLQLRSYI